MLQLRRDTIIQVVAVTFLVALIVPSMHHVAHWVQRDSHVHHSHVHHSTELEAPGEEHCPEEHLVEDCAACNLIGTLLSLPVDLMPESELTPTHMLSRFHAGVVVVSSHTTLNTRAPPVHG